MRAQFFTMDFHVLVAVLAVFVATCAVHVQASPRARTAEQDLETLLDKLMNSLVDKVTI